MPTKKDYEDMIARVDERTERIPIMEKHLGELNGAVRDTQIKLAKTSGIARNAEEKAEVAIRQADKAHGRVDRLFLTSLALIIALGIDIAVRFL